MSEEMIITPTITRDDLRNQVEQLVYKDKMTYAEAICEVCESLSIDPEDIVRIVTGPLKIKLEAEAMQRNIIKNTTSTLF
jgi:DNA-binding Xre family transcriptional regulator